MISKEYERRRRAIEEQCQADLDLIRAGCQAKLRALERVWLHSAGDEEVPRPDPGKTALSETAPSETVPSETVPSETAPSETVSVETVPREAPDGGAARAYLWAEVLIDVQAVLPDLPEIFDKRDLCQAIGYKPSRGTLLRVLETLKKEEKVAVAFQSDGGKQTQYRKVEHQEPPAG